MFLDNSADTEPAALAQSASPLLYQRISFVTYESGYPVAIAIGCVAIETDAMKYMRIDNFLRVK